jgi:multidrug efflux pump subunit AcrB
MTITLAAVYAPIGIQGGLTGALFREFAFTLAAAVIVSGVVALTLSPMMGASSCAPVTASAGSPAGSTGGSQACVVATPACSAARCGTGRSCSCSGCSLGS